MSYRLRWLPASEIRVELVFTKSIKITHILPDSFNIVKTFLTTCSVQNILNFIVTTLYTNKQTNTRNTLKIIGQFMSRSRQYSFELPPYTRYFTKIFSFSFSPNHKYTSAPSVCSLMQFNSAERVKDNTFYKLVQFIRFYPTSPGSRFSLRNFDKF
jgi:hypothetical protein